MSAAATEADARRAELVRVLLAVAVEDRVAFQRLYRLTSAKLFGICLRICGERQAAEDVLQDVYVQVWRRAGGYEPGRASPITWLATIARHRAIDWRRRQRPHAPLADATGAAEPVDTSPHADVALLADEERARLVDCLDALEQRPRAAVRTAFFDGVTYAELATREGVPLATMKSLIRRALLRLRACLSDDA
ncbi:sigma-70 family RNA polymerase sigma factor [Sphingomonas sp. DT-51]|uniref:sigma-70 family RNA polymerase sigma factor n=1 Tax=Sphingomonas sp. DT-51 TaxID=3396165 RepID=UPI003F1A3754